ncbi:MAG: pyruvate:ferredoxin (flavodoxin) oxidoreductase [Clostridia bacterium]|nr:pyruvate:ferredoxin (flavodoxin) oxidoreductase [Clostridia bacterium]
MKKITIDGNTAASNIAYMFNDVAVIYPITPSSPMAENVDIWSSEGKQNFFGNKVKVVQMQSEAGVAGAVHGSLVAGSKTTTFTSSQGLLLMIPNMYKIAGEGLPTVFYVAARSLATHALNIFCDYSDVYACLKTGFNIVNCSSVQEVNDMALACELASFKGGIPYICFFDGFRTSHELNTIYQTELSDLDKIITPTMFSEFQSNSMRFDNPYAMGTNQNPDVFMQNRVLTLNRYKYAIEDFNWALKQQQEITGRSYDTIEYIGDENAKNVVVTMGTSADVLKLAKDQYKGKVGIIKVRMLKPFDEQKFVELLPKSVKNITILERNLDVNGVDTLTSFVQSALYKNNIKAKTYSGCFGLGGKEFTPDMALAVFDNMTNKQKEFFTVGVTDDVTNTSLEVKPQFKDNVSDFSMRVYGLGSDGSVSSVKNTIKILGKETASFVQGYFDYDSKKSGSLTISHMRASFKPINAPFNATQVDVVMCNNEGFIKKYDITDCLKQNGTLIINTNFDEQILNEIMPQKMKVDINLKNISVYLIDADKIANEHGLKGKVNTIMQTAMFEITKLLPKDVAIQNIKSSIEKTYSRKGSEVVKANLTAVEVVESKIGKLDKTKITISNAKTCGCSVGDEYYENIIKPTASLDGNNIPVSKFNCAGQMPTNTSKFEKRAIAQTLPSWISEKCIQCGRCTMMCPHAAIRPCVVEENKKRPKTFETRKLFAGGGDYRQQVNALDCTGCGVCASVCPVKAIIMEDAEKIRDRELINEKFAMSVKPHNIESVKFVKDVQYKMPYFEFSGACAGCGETPYVKLATQLFGDRMLIANATGCSSIYGGTYPTCPYAKDKDGFGPSWANSLFEDNAEFGYGIAIARKHQRENFINQLKNMKFSKKISEKIENFIKNQENHEYNKQLIIELKKYKQGHILKNDETYLFNNLHLITSPSVWIFGGDGWAYDIGFGGLDHVVASGENVNILILDTEVYSNTGGQTSKSTPRGAVAKFNSNGKTTKKKDLASMLMTYKDVYVAQVSMGANPEQCLQAFIEAEKFDGPSVIIAYAPCVNHGYDMKHSQKHANNAVKSGYTTLFRYDPNKEEKMKVDSFDPTTNYEEFVETENRFAILSKVNKENRKSLLKQSEIDATERQKDYKTKK